MSFSTVKKGLIKKFYEEGECPHPSCKKTLRIGTEFYNLTDQHGFTIMTGYCSTSCLWKHHKMFTVTLDILPNTDINNL